MITLTNIADHISVFPLVIPISYTYIAITQKSKKALVFLLSFIIVTLSVDFMKSLSFPSYLNKYLMRPKDASNCNCLSNDGKAKPNTHGFPSGHMTDVSFFAVYTILSNSNPSFTLYSINSLIVILTGWARYYKRCHNVLQIVGGTVYGSICALGLYHITKKYNIIL